MKKPTYALFGALTYFIVSCGDITTKEDKNEFMKQEPVSVEITQNIEPIKSYSKTQIYQKFEETIKYAISLTADFEVINNELKWCTPIIGTFSNQTNLTLLTDSGKEITTLLIVLLKQQEYNECFDYLNGKKPYKKEGKDGFPMMSYYPETFPFCGHPADLIIVSSDLFMSMNKEFNSLALCHELQHLTQRKINHTNLDNISREIEAYTIEEKIFKKNLNINKQRKWDKLAKEAALIEPIENICLKNSRFISICRDDFGDDNLVNLLLVSALTPKGFVERFYVRKE